MSVYGLLLIASTLLMADMARLHTYIRPLEMAYVDARPSLTGAFIRSCYRSASGRLQILSNPKLALVFIPFWVVSSHRQRLELVDRCCPRSGYSKNAKFSDVTCWSRPIAHIGSPNCSYWKSLTPLFRFHCHGPDQWFEFGQC
jgi:hypothetical protein